MPIALNAETEALIEQRMARDAYGSPDDVVRAALTALDRGDPLARLTSDQLDALYPGFRDKIAHGLAQANAGQLLDGEAFFAELEREEQVADDARRLGLQAT